MKVSVWQVELVWVKKKVLEISIELNECSLADGGWKQEK